MDVYIFPTEFTKEEIVITLRNEFDNDIYPLFQKRERAYFNMAERQGVLRGRSYYHREQRKASSERKYDVICKFSKEGYSACFLTMFEWRQKFYYANFSDDKRVTIFSEHSIERYQERVLKSHGGSSVDTLRSKIVFCMNSSFHIVLTSPTHYTTVYFCAAGALFLGDYYISDRSNFIWMNTCVSVDMLYSSQYKIFNSLALLSTFVEKLGFDPLRLGEKNTEKEDKRFAEFVQKSVNLGLYKDFLRIKYLFCLLLSDIKFDFLPVEQIKEIEMKSKIALENLQIDISHYSPYDDVYGVVKKGEIDFNINKIR